MGITETLTSQSERYFIGTVKSQVQRGVFYASMYNFIQILFIGYENGAFSGIFPNFWVYLAAHAVVFAAIVGVDYKTVLPGEKDYQKRQDYLRDPLRDDVQGVQDQMVKLQQQLTDLQQQLEDDT